MSKLVLQMVGPEPIWVWEWAAPSDESVEAGETGYFDNVPPNTDRILFIFSKGAFGGAG